MRICITGASGTIGSLVARDLSERGYEVIATDMLMNRDLPCQFKVANLKKLGEVFEIINNCEAVIHCAANPSAKGSVPSRLLNNNFICAYNVLQAAHILNIPKVVIASSLTVYGLPFGKDNPPLYLPVDERHPMLPNSSYALGKKLVEEMSRDFYRWNRDFSIINLRITNVTSKKSYKKWLNHKNIPDWGLGNLWSYVDCKDVVQSVRKALETKKKMCESINITAADSMLSNIDQQRIREIWPHMEFKQEIKKGDGCISIKKAQRLLGYEPEHSWTEFV